MKNTKTGFVVLIINLIFLLLLYNIFYKERINSFIDPDDNLHLILKSETISNCIDKNCRGLNFFSEKLSSVSKYDQNEDESYLASRQIHRTISVYHPLVSYFIYFINQFFNDYEKTFKIFLLFNFCLINFSLFIFCKEFLSDKLFYFVYIFLLLLINSSLKSSYMYAHSTAFAFGILSFQAALNRSSYKGSIFAILSILSHSIGIAYAIIFILLKFFLLKNHFDLKKYTYFLLFSFLILFFYKFNIQLTNININNSDLYNQSTNDLNIIEILTYKLFGIKKHFESIPIFSSFGIYFVFILSLFSLTSSNKLIKNQKGLFSILISLSVVGFLSLFSNSTLAILERLQPLILSIIYICFLSCSFLSIKKLHFYFKQKKFNLLNLNNFEKNKLDIFNIFTAAIFVVLTLIFLRIELLKPDGVKYLTYLNSLDDSNYDNKKFNELIISSEGKNSFLVDGSEANLYFHMLNGLFNNQFYWSQIYNKKEKQEIIKNIDYLILENKLGFFSRKVRNAKQYYNQLYIDKNFDLKIENLNSKKIKLIFFSKRGNSQINFYNDNLKKEFKIKKGINIIELSNNKIIKNIDISSNSKILLSSIEIFENQKTNWPWESDLIITKKNKKIITNNIELDNQISFKLSEIMVNNYMCKNYSILGDNEMFLYLKVNCK